MPPLWSRDPCTDNATACTPQPSSSISFTYQTGVKWRTFGQSELGGVAVTAVAGMLSLLAILLLLIYTLYMSFLRPYLQKRVQLQRKGSLSTMKTYATKESFRPLILSDFNGVQSGGESFWRKQIGILLICLLVSDFIQAIAGVTQLHWLARGRIDDNSTCQFQGAMLTLGDVGTATWNIFLAIITFVHVVLKADPGSWVITSMVIGGWMGIIILNIIGPIMIATQSIEWFGIAGGWCFITSDHIAPRIVVHYLPILISGTTILVLYTLIFLHLRGYLSYAPSKGFMWTWSPDRLRNAYVKSASKKMLYYPLVYLVTILPDTVMRLAAAKGHSAPDGAWYFGMTLMFSMGFCNVILYVTTRDVLGLAKKRGGNTTTRRPTFPDFASSEGPSVQLQSQSTVTYQTFSSPTLPQTVQYSYQSPASSTHFLPLGAMTPRTMANNEVPLVASPPLTPPTPPTPPVRLGSHTRAPSESSILRPFLPLIPNSPFSQPLSLSRSSSPAPPPPVISISRSASPVPQPPISRSTSPLPHQQISPPSPLTHTLQPPANADGELEPESPVVFASVVTPAPPRSLSLAEDPVSPPTSSARSLPTPAPAPIRALPQVPSAHVPSDSTKTVDALPTKDGKQKRALVNKAPPPKKPASATYSTISSSTNISTATNISSNSNSSAYTLPNGKVIPIPPIPVTLAPETPPSTGSSSRTSVSQFPQSPFTPTSTSTPGTPFSATGNGNGKGGANLSRKSSIYPVSIHTAERLEREAWGDLSSSPSTSTVAERAWDSEGFIPIRL